MRKKYFIISIVFIIILYFSYIFLVIQPSNERNWESGFQRIPKIEMKDSLVTINDFRNYLYSPTKLLAERYTTRTVDINKLERAWFVIEPFGEIPIVKFNGIAHTYFVFDFADEEPIIVSVEARREKGETYGLISGLLNQFEIIYVWGSETDVTAHRVLINKDNLYMYPLHISSDSARKLFIQLARTTHDLEDHPRFYNTFTSNCTNELAKNANQVKLNSIPFDLVWFMPGYAAAELYKLGFIPNNKSLEEISKKYYISDLVKKYFGKPAFSKLLRDSLL